MNDIIKTLEYIKNNPECNSSNLDYNLVKDLYNDGYIDSIDIPVYRGASVFQNLRIKIIGETYLQSLKKQNSIFNIFNNKIVWFVITAIFLSVLTFAVNIMTSHYQERREQTNQVSNQFDPTKEEANTQQ